MLTTRDSRAVSEKIAVDLNANVTLPPGKPRVISREAAILFDDSVIARSLGVPEVTSINPKNLDYAYRWVNRDGVGGQIYQQRLAQGFTNATTEDVEILAADVQWKDGEIRAGDVILMKMQAERYDAAIKANMLQAMRLARTKGAYLKSGSSNVWEDESKTVGTISEEALPAKGVQQFIPPDVKAIVHDSISSGRVEETRRVSQTLGQES